MDCTGFKMLFLFVLTHHLSHTVAQQCLSPANFIGAVPFEEVSVENRVNFMHNGRQVIMTSYQFQCCGNITAWQTFVHPFSDAYRSGVYSIYFQVWRPTSPGQDDGCFSLTGEDKYENITLIQERQGLVNRTVPESSNMNVQPGDVVGFFLSLSGGKEGSIQFSQDTVKGFDEEQGWYNELPLTVSSDKCPFPIGLDQILTTSVRAAPVLSLDIAQFSCNGQTTTKQPAKSAENDKPTSLLAISEDGSRTGLIVAVVVMAIIILFMAVAVLMLVCLTVRKEAVKKRSKRRSGGEEMNNYTSPDDLIKDRASYTNETTHQDQEADPNHEDKKAYSGSALATDIDAVDAEVDHKAEGILREGEVEIIQEEKSTTTVTYNNSHENATTEEVETTHKDQRSKDVDVISGREVSPHEIESLTRLEEGSIAAAIMLF